MITTLTTVPFTIDADAIAEGLLEMFDENEKVALRFGMLPAQRMEVVRNCLRDRFLENCRGLATEDQYVAFIETETKRRFIEFSMKKLVHEAEHLVCLALYEIGDLVV